MTEYMRPTPTLNGYRPERLLLLKTALSVKKLDPTSECSFGSEAHSLGALIDKDQRTFAKQGVDVN